jgi:hypothetical protein
MPATGLPRCEGASRGAAADPVGRALRVREGVAVKQAFLLIALTVEVVVFAVLLFFTVFPPGKGAPLH